MVPRMRLATGVLCVTALCCDACTNEPTTPRTHDERRVAALAASDFWLGAEFETDAPVMGPAQYSQSAPLGDFDGDNYFFVWKDDRRGKEELFGAHVSRS